VYLTPHCDLIIGYPVKNTFEKHRTRNRIQAVLNISFLKWVFMAQNSSLSAV